MFENLGRNFKALIVDDHQAMRSMVKSLLSRLNIFTEVAEAGDGAEAWEMIVKSENAYDLIILDIGMPKLDGISLLKRFREDASLAYRLIIVVTGNNDPFTISNAIEIGADHVIVKPFSQKLLFDHIEILLERYNDPMELVFREIELLKKQGFYQEALNQLEALKIDYQKGKWLLLRGELLMKLGSTDEARKCFEGVTESNGTYFRALKNYANLQQNLHNNLLALEALKKLETINPFNVERKINLGDLLLKEGQIEEGKEVLNQATTMTDVNKELKIKIAEVFRENGRVEEAKEVFEKVMAKGEVNLDFCYKLGISFRKQKKFKEAEELYLKALLDHRQDKVLLYNTGILYLDMKENSKACDYFLNAVRIDPKFKEAVEMLEKFCPNHAKKLIFYQ